MVVTPQARNFCSSSCSAIPMSRSAPERGVISFSSVSVCRSMKPGTTVAPARLSTVSVMQVAGGTFVALPICANLPFSIRSQPDSRMDSGVTMRASSKRVRPVAEGLFTFMLMARKGIGVGMCDGLWIGEKAGSDRRGSPESSQVRRVRVARIGVPHAAMRF
jgi:hypothetical protein